MLKILNNDKFTTAQNRHSLVSLKIPILNTLPVRAKAKANHLPLLLPLQGVGVYALVPRALPWAKNWLPFQGARGEGCVAAPKRRSYSRIAPPLFFAITQSSTGRSSFNSL